MFTKNNVPGYGMYEDFIDEFGENRPGLFDEDVPALLYYIGKSLTVIADMLAEKNGYSCSMEYKDEEEQE